MMEKDKQATIDHLESRILELKKRYDTLLTQHQKQSAADTYNGASMQWQATFDATNSAIWILDKAFCIVRANKMACEMFKRTSNEMVGKRCWEIVHGSNEPILDCPVFRLQKSLQRESMEIQLNDRWYEVTADPILDNQGAYDQVVHIINDITERKLDMIELIEKDQLLEQSQKLANVGSYNLDLASQQVTWSKQVYKMFGYTPEEVHPDFKFVISHVHKNDRDEFIKANKSFFSGDSDYDEIYRIITKDGAVRTVRSKASLARDESGKPLQSYGAVQDITEYREMEAQLRQARKMEAIGTLAGGIAHDFNNILYMIIGNVELAIEDTIKSNPIHKYLQEIKTASFRAADIVKQLLNFSHKGDQHLKPVGLIATIESTLKFMRSTLPANIALHSHLPAAEIVIMANVVQIHQLIMNICINAYQAMELTGGDIRVRVDTGVLPDEIISTHKDSAAGRYAAIQITDSGPGIGAAHLDRIFDPYFTTKPVGEGSGMGLAVAHGIVKSHGGIISAQSPLEGGALFTIHFPIIDCEVPSPEAPKKIPRGSEAILFIDDEASIVTMGCNTLKRLGYQVTAKTNPLAAIDLFQADPQAYDLVITDMTMPQMNGVHLARQLKALRADIPVIICTGHGTFIDAYNSFDHDIDGCIIKPITKRKIANTIREVLDKG